MKFYTKTRLLLIFLILFMLHFQIMFTASDNSALPLTPDEIEFIETHPVIYLAVDPKFYPYEFLDSDGNYKGIAADYIKLISEKTGLQFEVTKNLTWEKAYEKAVLGELDGLSCVLKTGEREHYFLFSDPYFDTYRVIFVNNKNMEIHSFNDLKGKRIAVQKNSSHHSYLTDYPDLSLTLYSTVEEGLRAVSEGKEDAFIGNFATSNYIAKEIGITNLNYVTIEDQLPQSLHFAIRKDWPELISIINKALANITKEEQITINNTWIGVDSKVNYKLIYQIASIIGTIVLIVFIVSSYWIFKLKKEVRFRKQVEADLKVAKEEAEFANQVKSIFLARMSHEIRTPLNAITGMSYILRKTDLTTTQKLYLDKITRASKDMLSIINDILDFSKIESGKIELEAINFNLDEIIEQVINIVSYKIEEQHIEFSMHKDASIPTFFIGDPKKIGQVLLNVVNNALKFTKDGQVSIVIRLVAKVKDCYIIEFSIKDTGIGMSEKQLEQLFVPFSQADSSISRRFGGTGLGMSIVKNFIELMNGKIDVYSELGVGSTFNIQIPLEMDFNKDYEARKSQAALYFKNIRALVFDQSHFYTNLLREYLQSFNIVADFAQTEERTIEFLEKSTQLGSKPYNLLIVDYESPEANGIEFCKKLRAKIIMADFPKTILLVPLTRDDLHDALEAASLNLGIAKPIIPSVLYNGIVELFKFNIIEIHNQTAQDILTEPETSDFPYHILVVEDNLTNQFIAKSLLEQSGYVVTLADNGEVGVNYFKAHSDDFHLILMDLHMPVLNGYEASAQIRQMNQDIPIIAMTADAVTGVKEKCLNSGITHFITKPFEPELFVKKIKTVLSSTIHSQELLKSPSKVLSSDPGNIKTQSSGPEYSDQTPQFTLTADKIPERILDYESGLKLIGGNRELYQTILKSYWDENQDVLETLTNAIDQGQYHEGIQIIHKIKSSSGSIGAKLLYVTAVSLQRALTDEDTDQIKLYYDQFKKIIEKLFVELKDICTP